MNFDEGFILNSKEFFYSLYGDVNGSSISWKARNRMSDDEIKHLIYGEIDFDGLKEVYSSPSLEPFLKNVSSFCDLGSGTGKIVIGTALLLPNLKRCVGIELLKELYDKSIEIQNFVLQNYVELSSKIEFINEDFFNVDLSKFDMIFMHYPMKNAEDLYLKLEEKMKRELRVGSIIITAIRKLRNRDVFPCIKKEHVEADYGKTNIYYHVKYEKDN